jgi:hypothetical protein
MSKTVTIYCLTWSGEIVRHYFYGTRREAEDQRRELMKEYPGDIVDVLPTEVTLTRQGIAEAMDGVIAQTCTNDG